MHSQRDYKPVSKQVINPEKEKKLNELLNTQKSSDNISQEIIKDFENTINEYKEEMDTIQNVAACFGYLLNKHSNSVTDKLSIF